LTGREQDHSIRDADHGTAAGVPSTRIRRREWVAAYQAATKKQERTGQSYCQYKQPLMISFIHTSPQ
jgi:hypothetical protein